MKVGNDKEAENTIIGQYISLGLMFGCGFGCAMGLLVAAIFVPDNFGLGMLLGIAAGAAIGYLGGILLFFIRKSNA